MIRIRAILAVAVLIGAAMPVQAQERYALGGREAAVYNLAGTVQVEAGEGRDVTVEVTRGGRDARELRVVSGALDGRQALRVIYPGDRVVYGAMGQWSRTTLTVREDGTFGERGGGRRVEVTRSGPGLDARADLVVRVPQGAKLAVYLAVGKVDVANVEGDLQIRTNSAPIETRTTRGALDITVGSGGVNIADAQGQLSIQTGSGGVTARGVRSETLRLNTGSGGITGSELDIGTLSVDVGSGGVRLANVRMQEGKVRTGSGRVEIELRSTIRSLLIDTGSGGVRLNVPSNLDAQLAIATGSGGVEVDGPVTVRERSRRSFHGQLGEGRGRIRIDTGSGGVRVRQS